VEKRRRQLSAGQRDLSVRNYAASHWTAESILARKFAMRDPASPARNSLQKLSSVPVDERKSYLSSGKREENAQIESLSAKVSVRNSCPAYVTNANKNATMRIATDARNSLNSCVSVVKIREWFPATNSITQNI